MKKAQPREIALKLLDTVTEARAHFQIWWALETEEPKLSRVKRTAFLDFLQPTRIAHFKCMLLAICSVFDDDPRVASLAKLQRLRCFADDDELGGRLERLKADGVLKGLLKIRNNSVAHASSSISISQLYVEANLIPNDVEKFIEDTAEIVRDVLARFDAPNTVFESDRAARVTISLLRTL